MDEQSNAIEQLQLLLLNIQRHDANYERRYGMVLRAVAKAHSLGLKAGFRFDPKEPDWPVAFIELPTGQVSWHLPPHPIEWDRHTTEEKYERIRRWFFGEGTQ